MAYTQIPLAELQATDKIAHVVKVSKVEIKPAKNGGKPWLDIYLSDKSGRFVARKWQSSEEEHERYQKIDVAIIEGVVETYKEKTSLIVKTMAQVAIGSGEEEMSQAEVDALIKRDETHDDIPMEWDGIFEITTKDGIDFLNRVKNQTLLRDLKVGDSVDHVFQSKSFANKKSQDKPSYYFDIQVNDLSKEMLARKFRSNKDAPEPEVKAVHIVGRIDDFKGRVTIKAEAVKLIMDATDEDVSCFWPASTFTVRDMKIPLWARVQKIKNPWVKKLCEDFLQDPNYKKAFEIVPAGSSMHHNFKHGLLEHTYTASSMGSEITELYNRLEMSHSNLIIDEDIVFAGLIFHDAFKCEEYAPNGNYLPAGNLLKHLERGISYIAAKAASIPEFPEPVWQALCHIVSSHHGKLEWGSWDEICSPPASVVHHVDDMTSKLDPTVRELNLIKEGEKFTSEKVKAIGGSFGAEAIRGNIRFDKPSYESSREIKLSKNLTVDDVTSSIRDLLERIEDKQLKRLVIVLLDKFKDEAVKAPGYEHYSCGLLEFTLRLMLLSEGVVYIWHKWAWPKNRVYLDVDTVVAGAFLTTFFQFRKGHPIMEDTSFALAQIGIEASKIPEFSIDLKELLQHIVRSNLGRDDVKFISTESILIYYCYKMLNMTDRMTIDLSKATDEIVDSPLMGRKIFRSFCKDKE